MFVLVGNFIGAVEGVESRVGGGFSVFFFFVGGL